MTDKEILCMVEKELEGARKKFPEFNSAHEGYAVIKEELDELWEEVKAKGFPGLHLAKMHNEAIQVAAMAVRFVVDVCSPDN